MSEGIIIALITAGFGFLGVIYAKHAGNSKLVDEVKTENAKAINAVKEKNDEVINALKIEFAKSQAITDTKIEELTREVREHNNFAKRMPVVENEIQHIEEKMKELHKNDNK